MFFFITNHNRRINNSLCQDYHLLSIYLYMGAEICLYKYYRVGKDLYVGRTVFESNLATSDMKTFQVSGHPSQAWRRPGRYPIQRLFLEALSRLIHLFWRSTQFSASQLMTEAWMIIGEQADSNQVKVGYWFCTSQNGHRDSNAITAKGWSFCARNLNWFW